MAFPKKDSLLVAFSSNFNDRIVAEPATFSLSAAQAALYTPLHTSFVDSYNAVVEAREAGTRSKSLVQIKDQAKFDLLRYGRELYKLVQASLTVTDANKTLLGVKVIDRSPTPVPAPNAAPEIKVTSVYGRDVRLSIKDASGTRKGRPIGVVGCSLYSFIGPSAPTTNDGWKSEGNITKNDILVKFAESVTPGTKVWFTGFWYSLRGLSGPECTPISAHIGFEGAQPLAA
jgi:hypothetical protein